MDDALHVLTVGSARIAVVLIAPAMLAAQVAVSVLVIGVCMLPAALGFALGAWAQQVLMGLVR